MTSRNLTEVFVIMRNNALHNRQMYAEDRVSSYCFSIIHVACHVIKFEIMFSLAVIVKNY